MQGQSTEQWPRDRCLRVVWCDDMYCAVHTSSVSTYIVTQLSLTCANYFRERQFILLIFVEQYPLFANTQSTLIQLAYHLPFTPHTIVILCEACLITINQKFFKQVIDNWNNLLKFTEFYKCMIQSSLTIPYLCSKSVNKINSKIFRKNKRQ